MRNTYFLDRDLENNQVALQLSVSDNELLLRIHLFILPLLDKISLPMNREKSIVK